METGLLIYIQLFSVFIPRLSVPSTSTTVSPLLYYNPKTLQRKTFELEFSQQVILKHPAESSDYPDRSGNSSQIIFSHFNFPEDVT